MYIHPLHHLGGVAPSGGSMPAGEPAPIYVYLYMYIYICISVYVYLYMYILGVWQPAVAPSEARGTTLDTLAKP